jgi:GNAT superfamily N-acetyltransferase
MIENHLGGYIAWLFSSPYSRVENEPEFMRTTSDIPHPMCNYVCHSRFSAREVGARVDKMMDFFKSRKLPISWLVGPSCRPSNLAKVLVSRGFVLDVEVVGMTIDLRHFNEDLPIPESLAIKRVENDNDMRQYLKPLGEGFGFPEFVTSGWGRMDSSHGFGLKLPRVDYVAAMEGKPVSCTTLFKTRDAAGIYCVATVAEMRRKGAATALIITALREARDEGYRMGLLQAKTTAAGVYRRIGFVDQPCKIGWYVWHPPDPAPEPATGV